MATIIDEDTKKVERFSISEPMKPDLEIGEVHDLDEAEIFLRDNNYGHERLQELLSDEAGVKKLIRRVDLRLLPLLAGTYVLQYIDKQALSYAAVFDLFSDTGINQNQYSWFPSMFYLAYLVAEYPWSALAQRTYMAKVVSGCVICWGAILMITAASTNFAGMATCRTLLGVFEAPITPCFMMIVSMWYMRDEQPFRAGIFYSCNGFGAMVGGILSYCIGQIDTFPVWKAIFLLCGGLTVIWGVVMYFFLVPTIIGVALMWKLDRHTQKVGVLFGYYISGAYVSSLVVTLQMPAANLAGYTKRTTGTAIVFAAYCVGNVIGPHAFLDSEAPVYQTGCKVCMACAICQVFIAFGLRMLLVWRNKKKEAAIRAVPLDDPVVDESSDITDFENPRFRYML